MSSSVTEAIFVRSASARVPSSAYRSTKYRVENGVSGVNRPFRPPGIPVGGAGGGPSLSAGSGTSALSETGMVP